MNFYASLAAKGYLYASPAGKWFIYIRHQQVKGQFIFVTGGKRVNLYASLEYKGLIYMRL